MTATEPFVHPGLAQAADVADLARPADRTLRGEVLDELRVKRPHRHITLLVPERDGYTVEFDVKLDADLVKRWSLEAVDDQGRPDMFQLALLVIAGQCVAIWRQGERLTIGGQPVTFGSPELADAVGVLPGQSTHVVRLFYDNDNDVAAVHQRIMQEASAGSLDPTTESSS